MFDEIEISEAVIELGRTIHEAAPVFVRLLGDEIGMGPRRVGMEIDERRARRDTLQRCLRAQIVARDQDIGIVLVDEALAGADDDVIALGFGILESELDRAAQNAAQRIDLLCRHFEAALEFDAVGGDGAGQGQRSADDDRRCILGARRLIEAGEHGQRAGTGRGFGQKRTT